LKYRGLVPGSLRTLNLRHLLLAVALGAGQGCGAPRVLFMVFFERQWVSALFFLAVSCCSGLFIKPTHEDLYFSEQNWAINATRAVTVNPGAYFRFNFTQTANVTLQVGGRAPCAVVHGMLPFGGWLTAGTPLCCPCRLCADRRAHLPIRGHLHAAGVQRRQHRNGGSGSAAERERDPDPLPPALAQRKLVQPHRAELLPRAHAGGVPVQLDPVQRALVCECGGQPTCGLV
jgi:hypothetical protein